MRIAVTAVENERGHELKDALIREFRQLAEVEVEIVDSEDQKDIMIVCGGDGFLLAVVRKYLDSTKAFFGINLGTVGFMMNEFDGQRPEEIIAIVKKVICEKQYKEMSYVLLRGEVEYFDKPSETVYAFNEFSIERQSVQAARLVIVVDGLELPTYSGDGLLIGTPVGSTSYTLSAGGAPIDHRARCFILTPNNPQKSAEFANLTVSFVLSAETVLDIRVAEAAKRPVKIVADGYGIDNMKSVRISADRGKTVSLLWLPEWNYFERFGRKIIGVKARRQK